MIMALTSSGQPVAAVNIPILLVDTAPTVNLLGYTGPTPPRRDEIRQILAASRITEANFPEAIPNTRFNNELFIAIDIAIGQLNTFEIEMVHLTKLSTQGSEACLITATPVGANNPIQTRFQKYKYHKLCTTVAE